MTTPPTHNLETVDYHPDAGLPYRAWEEHPDRIDY